MGVDAQPAAERARGVSPWVIVAAAAPRRLVYAHEFSWDRERDPVWKRLQRVFAFYGVPEHLAFAHGAGVLSGRPPEATHCNQVGAAHRGMLYPPLQRWFGIPVPDEEYRQRLPEEMLACLPAGGDEPAGADRPSLPFHRRLHEPVGRDGRFSRRGDASIAGAADVRRAASAPA